MKIAFEQLFYGRGERGYGMLGVSPGGRAFATRVESLCGAVGTPGSDYGGEPFLISAPDGEHVIMLCGRRGAPDSMGRSTLFFQALVASKAEMAKAKADAFSLFLQGAFLGKMPKGEIDLLNIDVACGHEEKKNVLFNVATPCAIRSAKPAMEIVRGVVGENTLNCSWATFTFQPIPDLYVQILPPRVPCSRNLNEYDEDIRLVSPAVVSNVDDKDGISQARSSGYRGIPIEKIADKSSKNKSSAMLKFSLFVNFVLAVACGALLVFIKTNPVSHGTSANRLDATNSSECVDQKTVSAKLSAAQKAEIENSAIKRYISGLNSRFPKEMEMPDFESEARELPKYSDINKFPDNYMKAKNVLDKLRFYVDFVNKNLLKGKTP